MWTGFIIVPVVISCFVCFVFWVDTFFRYSASTFQRRIWIAIPIILGLFIGSTNFLEYSVSSSVARIDAQGNVIPDQDVVLCSTSNDCINYYDNDGLWFSISSQVSPITDNPKVRTVSYRISYKVNDFGKLLRATINSTCYFRVVGSDNFIVTSSATMTCAKELLDYHLYEFNNEHSKKLAGFYNPLSTGQKLEFLAMLEEYLGPKYAPFGVEITSVEWAID